MITLYLCAHTGYYESNGVIRPLSMCAAAVGYTTCAIPMVAAVLSIAILCRGNDFNMFCGQRVLNTLDTLFLAHSSSLCICFVFASKDVIIISRY